MMVKKVFGEPLVWFMIIGTVIFFLKNTWLKEEGDYQIRVTQNDVSRIRSQWEAQSTKPLSEIELRSLLEDYVLEEILYREAIRLGLDQNDVIIRRRLVQKLQFLVEDVSKKEIPTTSKLQTFFNKHSDLYVLLPRISFSHLYFNRKKRGATTDEDLRLMRAKLNEEAIAGDASKINRTDAGDPFMLQFTYHQITPDETANLFGRAFADAIFKLKADRQWHGPVESGYGAHLVTVSSYAAARYPSFEEARDKVTMDFEKARREQVDRDMKRKLRKKYQIFMDVNNSEGKKL
jgi:peptidyl-prolyl cis-trans isomerase C